MKTFLKTLKYFAVFLAACIGLSYAFGYDYLFKGVAKTYLRGETSATIDDGKLFTSNVIEAKNPKPWQKDSLYNKQKLAKNILQDLEKSNTSSLIIIKNGKLLHEEYWNGANAKTKSNSFSMAKTITVLLLGKAIEDKKIENLNEKYSDFYDNYAKVPFGNKLTMRDLAAMEAGLDWNENYSNPFSPNARAYYGNSLAEAVFLRGFKEEPGKKFEYQSGATQLLGFAIRKAVNEPLSTYLSKKIWTPIGMEQNADWSTDENNMEKTFCCIHSSSRDFAKLGQLFLDDGKVDSLQIINQNFLKEMLTPNTHSENTYGLGTWLNYENPTPYYFLWGLQGQYVIVIPSKKMVIVRTGSYKDQQKNDKGRPDQVKFLVNEIMKSF
jgi:CubicO group peptidase (beta-lactamase class C family)